MSEHVTHLQPAYVLHCRPYRETSLILDLLTKEQGKIALLAKAVRKNKSTTVSLLQPFFPLLVSYSGKSELQNLSYVELNPPVISLKGMALYCGFYLNELIGYFLQVNDPCPDVYQYYSQCLNFLQKNPDDIESGLRLFELQLLEAVGYGLQLSHDLQEQPVDAEKKYNFLPDQGPIIADDGEFSGKSLKDMQKKILENKRSLSEAKILLRQVIDYHLQGRVLKSRSLIRKMYQK